MKLVQVSINNHGAYFTYQLPVQRGIKGKTKSKVNEVLIIGVPTKNIERYCENNNLIITNKAVYINDLDSTPLLYRDGETMNYLEKEELNNE